VLNEILNEYTDEVIALTSIGLDGEEIDNVTNKPKPRIKVRKNMIIATASSCLLDSDFEYVLHENTNIRTALGNIKIVEVTKSGLALVAGPSKKSEMISLVKMLKKYDPKNIFIDGALFRKSIAATTVSDSIILSTGASYNTNLNIVVDDTKTLIDQLRLSSTDLIFNIEAIDGSFTVDINDKITEIDEIIAVGASKVIKENLNDRIKYLCLKGALTKTIIDELIDMRHLLKNLTIVVKDATHIVSDYKTFNLLEKANIKVEVQNQIDLLFLSYNPYSPYGYTFDNEEFKKLLKMNIQCDCINVLKDME